MAYWDLAKVRLEHFNAASKYKTIENEARRAREIHVHDEDYETLKKRVMELTARYDELGESSGQSFDVAFWLSDAHFDDVLYIGGQAIAAAKLAVDRKRKTTV